MKFLSHNLSFVKQYRFNSSALSSAALSIVFAVGSLISGQVLAEGEVTHLSTHMETATPFRYSAGGETLTWGGGTNLVIDSVDYNGRSYSYIGFSDDVRLVRVDRPGIASGEPCAIFGERGADHTLLHPSYSSPGQSESCDMAAMIAGRIINRGALDVFSNVPPMAKNIERIDIIFNGGVLAPVRSDLMKYAGHLASEKRGNNPIYIAAIRALDHAGEPSEYGPLVRINPAGCQSPDICYGITPLAHNYSHFKTSAVEPNGLPAHLKDSTESVAMAFISLERLGLTAGSRYYGYSYFPKDVAGYELTRPESFPGNTADNDAPGDGADIYGGMSGYLIADSSGVGTGTIITADVFLDSNGNTEHDEGEAGVEGITLTLFEDVNDNALYDQGIDNQIGDSLSTNAAGVVFFPGLQAGEYLLLLDEQDDDIPPGLGLTHGSNPVPVSVPAANSEPVKFAFVDLSTVGTTDGATTDGTTTDGATTDGGTTDGTTIIINDDSNPVAVDDSVISDQDKTFTIDVLANDIDPLGQGLTILSVTGVSNGTVTIGNGMLEYQPEQGFVGTTAFMYVIEDGAGQQSTGSVTVSLVMFSDINDNGLNDFIECQCTDLGLITGVHGSGLGSLSVLFMGLLLLPVGIRRRVLQVGERS